VDHGGVGGRVVRSGASEEINGFADCVGQISDPIALDLSFSLEDKLGQLRVILKLETPPIQRPLADIVFCASCLVTGRDCFGNDTSNALTVDMVGHAASA
jgi:hypothetical protein